MGIDGVIEKIETKNLLAQGDSIEILLAQEDIIEEKINDNN